MIANVVGMGARGPLGLSSLQVATSVRARRFEPRSVALRDRHGHEIGLALAGGHGERLTGFERHVALAAPPLVEAHLEAGIDPRRTNVPLVLCLPEPGRPDDDPRFEGAIVDELVKASGRGLDLARSSVVRLGHAGFAEALRRARGLLDGGVEHVVVGGVDSHYHAGVLRWLDATYRLYGIDSENGFIPSEAAAFLVLSRDPGEGGRGRRLGRILAAELGDEPSARDEALPNTGEAMTALVLRALELGGSPGLVLTDENAEAHRQLEWERVTARLLRLVARETWVWHTGEVGAATGALFATIYARLSAFGARADGRALLALHSELGARGVVVLEGDHG
ncbi:MAG: hypothetical protein FJ095_13705 [Deltaproteobacteria bacterium]|nr:hypothetical protein [Deltaproteobacteria bacterium]